MFSTSSYPRNTQYEISTADEHGAMAYDNVDVMPGQGICRSFRWKLNEHQASLRVGDVHFVGTSEAEDVFLLRYVMPSLARHFDGSQGLRFLFFGEEHDMLSPNGYFEAVQTQTMDETERQDHEAIVSHMAHILLECGFLHHSQEMASNANEYTDLAPSPLSEQELEAIQQRYPGRFVHVPATAEAFQAQLREWVREEFANRAQEYGDQLAFDHHLAAGGEKAQNQIGDQQAVNGASDANNIEIDSGHVHS